MFGFGQALRGSACPPTRALPVNLKYDPHKAYWFLHWHRKSPFGITNARPSPSARVFWFPWYSPIGNTIYIPQNTPKVNASWPFKKGSVRILSGRLLKRDGMYSIPSRLQKRLSSHRVKPLASSHGDSSGVPCLGQGLDAFLTTYPYLLSCNP